MRRSRCGDRGGRSLPSVTVQRNSIHSQPIPLFPVKPEMSVPVLIPRTRTISVRLSEEEHAALEKFCLEGGARCISDLARNAIRSFVSPAGEESAVLAGLVQNSTQVKELEEKLELLAVEFAALKAGMLPPTSAEAAEVAGKTAKSRRKREQDHGPGEAEGHGPGANR